MSVQDINTIYHSHGVRELNLQDFDHLDPRCVGWSTSSNHIECMQMRIRDQLWCNCMVHCVKPCFCKTNCTVICPYKVTFAFKVKTLDLSKFPV